MINIGRIVTGLYQKPYKYLSVQQEIYRLSREEHPKAKPIAKALSEMLADRKSAEEKNWIAKIESLRTALNESTTEIPVYIQKIESTGTSIATQTITKKLIATETLGEVCRRNSKPYRWALLLFKLIRELQPSACLELGTCLGISTAYQAAALELNNHGSLVTIEANESYAAFAEQNFKKLSLDGRVNVINGQFQNTLDRVLHEQRQLDFVFIDGHHDEYATIDYFKQILPYLSPNAAVIFDDIAWSAGMHRAWQTIQLDSSVKLSVDLFNVGICIVSP